MNGLRNIVKYRLMIMYKNKIMIGLTALVVGLFAILISTLYRDAGESSKIAVAVVDQDHTAMSGRILKYLEDDPILNSIEVAETEGMNLLKQDKVQAVYVLSAGLEEQVAKENYEEIIQVYYLKGNTISKFIGDLFAEKVLRDLCLIKSVHLLERAMDHHQMDQKEVVLQEAFQTGLAMQDYSDHQYYVNVEFVKDNMNIESENIDKTILYKKMILGMILSFIAFYILFASIGIVKDKETYVEDRLRVSCTHPMAIVIGQYLSLVISGGIVSILFGILSYVQGENFVQTTMILILFVMSISALVLFFTQIVNTVGNHMLIVSIIILIMGVMSGSFFSIDVITSGLKYMSYVIPHYLTMNALTDNLSLGSEAVVQVDYIWYCLLYSGILLVVTCILRNEKKTT